MESILGAPEGRADLGRCVLLHCRGDVAVKVERGCHRRMPEPLLRHLRMHPGEQEVPRVSMPKVVEAHTRNVLNAGNEAGDTCVRLRGCTGSPSARAHRSISADWRTPSFSNFSACSRFSLCSSSAAKAGSVISRAFSLLGASARSPAFVCSKLSTTRRMLRSRSTLRQRNASCLPLLPSRRRHATTIRTELPSRCVRPPTPSGIRMRTQTKPVRATLVPASAKPPVARNRFASWCNSASRSFSGTRTGSNKLRYFGRPKDGFLQISVDGFRGIAW